MVFTRMTDEVLDGEIRFRARRISGHNASS